MTELEILSKTQNLVVDTVVQQAPDGYICAVQLNLFNPEKFVHNGGPVTVKSVKVQAFDKNFEGSQDKALTKAVQLLGLKGE